MMGFFVFSEYILFYIYFLKIFCKFRYLNFIGVKMKRILILLICGFTFTQSIQTKQIEVTINHIDEYTLFVNTSNNDYKYGINIMDYINEVSGNYNVEISNVITPSLTSQINNSFRFKGCNQSGITEPTNSYSNNYTSWVPSLPGTPGNITIDANSYINSDCPYIMIAGDEAGPDGLSDGSESMILILWVML